MDKILAKVGALSVTESEVDEFHAGLGARGQAYNNPEGRKVILEQLIGNKLILQDARRNLLEGEAEYRAELARVKERLVIRYAQNKILSAVKVTDSEVAEYYESHKSELAGGESVSAAHILVDTEEKALEILAKIKSGEVTFEDAARENSSCPSGQNGGDLGTFTRGQMVPEFDKAVFEMAVGEITDAPVKTQFGYHLIKLSAKNESKVPSLDEVKAELTEALLNEKRREAYEKKLTQLKIVYPVDM